MSYFLKCLLLNSYPKTPLPSLLLDGCPHNCKVYNYAKCIEMLRTWETDIKELQVSRALECQTFQILSHNSNVLDTLGIWYDLISCHVVTLTATFFQHYILDQKFNSLSVCIGNICFIMMLQEAHWTASPVKQYLLHGFFFCQRALKQS